VVSAFKDNAKRDLVLKRIKSITTDGCYNFVESIVKKAIQNGY